MGRRSKVFSLPKAVRDELKELISRNDFSRYEEISRWLADTHGFKVSRSSLQRFGTEFDRRMGLLKKSSAMAREVPSATPAEADSMIAATHRLATQLIFELLLSIENRDEKLLLGAVDGVAKMARAGAQIAAQFAGGVFRPRAAA